MILSTADLRDKLEALLSDILGVYKNALGVELQPALYVGEPPSDWVVEGLEVTVSPNPEFGVVNAHQVTSTWPLYEIRVIPHHAALNASTAVTRIVETFEATPPIFVPGNEALSYAGSYVTRVTGRGA